MKKTIIILALIIPLVSFAQKEAKLIRKGNKSYEGGNYKEAEINYRKSLQKNNQSIKGNFNLGDAMYEQENYEGSQQQFHAISKMVEDPDIKAKAFHNLGNSFLAANKLQESVEAYKHALRNNPDDDDTRYNLEYARQKLQEQQQEQEQENQDQNEDEQQQNEDEQEQDQNKDQEEKEEEQDQKDQEQNKEQSEDEQQQKNQQQPKQISKQDAEKMLQALKNEEKKTIEKLKKAQAESATVTKTEKDW